MAFVSDNTASNLDAPVSDSEEVLGVDWMTLDGVHRSVVRLERHCDFLHRRLCLATADVSAAHLCPYHELGWLQAQQTDTSSK